MKRILCLALCFAFLLSLPFALSQAASAQSEVWDGIVATSFESGSGTEDDPFIIKNASQLALASRYYSNGKATHYKLVSDIRLNDETFTFDPDSGLVKVTDGSNTAYLGTGIKGDITGENTVFDKNASEKGAWYPSDTSNTAEHGCYKGTIIEWTPINIDSFKVLGSFDGGGHTVSGAYVNSAKDNIGLFGKVQNTNIKDITVSDSYFMGRFAIGGVVSSFEVFPFESLTDPVTVNNCKADRVICIGEIAVGGIVGALDAKIGGVVQILNSFSNAAVFASTESAGGICGRVLTLLQSGASVESCENAGKVYGETNVGGIAGECTTSGMISAVIKSKNAGSVVGLTNVGGIVGLCEASGKNCNALINFCSNSGYIFAEGNFVGGIAGYGYADEGIVEISRSANTGTVKTKDKNAGGIVGSCFANEGGVAYVLVAYNTGTVYGDSRVGGIAGQCRSKKSEATLAMCYSVGYVYGDEQVGGVVGINTDATVNLNYYLENTARDITGKYQGGIGTKKGEALKDIMGMTYAFDETALRSQASYAGFDFAEHWTINANAYYKYPTIKGEEYTTHKWTAVGKISDPTEKEFGEMLHICSECSEYKIEPIFKLYVEQTTPNVTTSENVPTTPDTSGDVPTDTSASPDLQTSDLSGNDESGNDLMLVYILIAVGVAGIAIAVTVIIVSKKNK